MTDYRVIDVLVIEGNETKQLVYHPYNGRGVKFGATDDSLETIKFAFGRANIINVIKLRCGGAGEENSYTVQYPTVGVFGTKITQKTVTARVNKRGEKDFCTTFLQFKPTKNKVLFKVIYPDSDSCEMNLTKLCSEEPFERNV